MSTIVRELTDIQGVSVSVPSENGPVTGPSSSTNNTIPRFDGIDGDLLKGSTIAVDDSGNMTGVGSIDFVGALRGSAFTASEMLITNSSKDIISLRTALLGDISGSLNTATVTITIATPGVVSHTSHGKITGQKVFFTTTGALPTGLSITTTYYIIRVNADSYQLASTYANAMAATAITTSGSQSGVHTASVGGLVLTPGNQRGLLDGSTIGSGYIGEKLTGTFLTPTWVNATPNNIASLVLPAGIWDVYGKAQVGTSGSTQTSFSASIGTTSLTHNAKTQANDNTSGTTLDRNIPTGSLYISTTGTTVYLVGTVNFTGGAPVSTSGFNDLYAVRRA